MRLLLVASLGLVVAACSGATSSELFGEAPSVGDAPSPTEPAPAEEDDAAPATTKDASTKDVVPPPDAADAAKEAAAQKCSVDIECKVGEACNWKTDVCAAPGPIGAACKRDLECKAALCNWKLEICSDPAPAGTACRRNKECASGSCGASGICK